MQKHLNIFLIIIFSLILSQPLELLEQKKDLEIYYRDKILFLLTGNVLDKTRFTVDVYVQLNGGHQGNANTFDNKEVLDKTQEGTPKKDSNSLEFLLGTPIKPKTADQIIKSNANERVNAPANNLDEFDIRRIDVIVYLDDFISTGAVKTNVEKIIRNVLPRKFGSCEDCIRINSLNMQNNMSSGVESSSDKKPEQSKANIKNQKINEDIKDIKTSLNSLLKQQAGNVEGSPGEANTYLKKLKKQIAYYDSLEEDREDSLKTENKRLATEYEKLRDQQSKDKEALLKQTTAQLLDVQKDKDTLSLDWIESETQKEDRNHKFSEKVVYISLGVATAIILILLLAFIFRKNQKVETVYLKRKKQSAKKDSKNDKKKSKGKDEEPNESGEQPTEEGSKQSQPAEQAPQAPGATPTQAFEDPNVLKSEVGTLRQSAISMTIGQKEAANKIISDWLQDAPKDEGEEGEGEEGEGAE